MVTNKKLIHQQVAEERLQGHPTRKSLYNKIEKGFGGVTTVAFFTSFAYPVMLEDGDADMLEGILRKADLKNGLTLIVSSPGGIGLAAERIIRICRSYSGNGKYDVIVPGKAKSAATMICLGANKIVMSKTSELGPVDPQIVYNDNGKQDVFSVYNLIKSYDDLFDKAVKEKGNLQPYLQQLNNYDERHIQELRMQMAASRDITCKALKTGMLSGLSETEIEAKVKSFLTPENVKTHGRAIYADDVKKCGINVDIIDLHDARWEFIYELYFRLDSYVSRNKIAKCIESKDVSYTAKYSEG